MTDGQAYQKEYYQKNKEAIAENKKKYHQENKEARAEYHKKYRQKNKEVLIENKKKYHQENKEDICKKKRKYYQENKEIIAEKKKRYYQKNKELHSVARHRRRARIVKVGGKFTKADIRTLYILQWARCYYCSISIKEKYHIDHMTPLIRSGSNWVSNLCLTCPECNMTKHTQTAEEFIEQKGFMYGI